MDLQWKSHAGRERLGFPRGVRELGGYRGRTCAAPCCLPLSPRVSCCSCSQEAEHLHTAMESGDGEIPRCPEAGPDQLRGHVSLLEAGLLRDAQPACLAVARGHNSAVCGTEGAGGGTEALPVAGGTTAVPGRRCQAHLVATFVGTGSATFVVLSAQAARRNSMHIFYTENKVLR